MQASCLAVLLLLMLGVELFPFQHDGVTLRANYFLLGFGNEALITICALLVLARGVEISGALRPVGAMLARLWLINRPVALLVTLVIAAVTSAFVNNTPIIVMLLPVLVGVALRIEIAPSRILMPVGFATILGGMTTTIGTSTNLLVVSVAADLGVVRFQMFDFVLPAVIGTLVGILYLWVVAPFLLPDRKPPMTIAQPRVFRTVIEVTKGSPLAKKTLAEALRLVDPKLKVARVVRGSGVELVRLPQLMIESGDRLSVHGTAEAIKQAQNLFGGGFDEGDLLKLPDQTLVELVVTEESPLHDKRLSEVRTLLLDQLFPIGLYRPGSTAPDRFQTDTDPLLCAGDILLVQGRRQDIRKLKEQPLLLILDRTIHVARSAKATQATVILAGVVLTAAIGVLPIAVSALCGVGLMLLTRCIAWDEVWDALDSRLILLIVTSLALGSALTVSGAAAFIANGLVSTVRDLPPPVILAGLLLFFSLLTELVTNNAVAVLGTPIAVGIARELGLPEVPFVLAVLFGANMSYITPIGYQTNLLVFSAGGYRFTDFMRVGIPLQILVWLALSFALSYLYL